MTFRRMLCVGDSGDRFRTSFVATCLSQILGLYLINSGMAPRVMAFAKAGELRIIDSDGYRALIARYGNP